MSLGTTPFRPVAAPAIPADGAGPKLDEVKADKDSRYATTVRSTGSQFEMPWPLICVQRIPFQRDLAILRFGHGGLQSIEQFDDNA